MGRHARKGAVVLDPNGERKRPHALFTLDLKVIQRLHDYADENKIPRSHVVENAIIHYLNHVGAP